MNTEPQETGRALERSAKTQGILGQLAIPEHWSRGQGEGEFITTLDTANSAGRKGVLAALNGKAEGIEDYLNRQITVVGWTIHPATKTNNETGEIDRLVRSILHLDNGKVVQAFSAGILKSMRQIALLEGPPSFDHPLKLMPRRIATSGERSMYQLELVD